MLSPSFVSMSRFSGSKVTVQLVLAVRISCHVNGLAGKVPSVGITPTDRHPLHESITSCIHRLLRCAGQVCVNFRRVHDAEAGLVTLTLGGTGGVDGPQHIDGVSLEVKMIVCCMKNKCPGQVLGESSTLGVDALIHILAGLAARSRDQLERTWTAVPARGAETQLRIARCGVREYRRSEGGSALRLGRSSWPATTLAVARDAMARQTPITDMRTTRSHMAILPVARPFLGSCGPAIFSSTTASTGSAGSVW